MNETRLSEIERKIRAIKEALNRIGLMRPGTLTRQYKDPANKRGSYWQISYTRNMKSRSEYVRKECVSEIRKQIAANKRSKRLADEWIDLGIEMSKLILKREKTKSSK